MFEGHACSSILWLSVIPVEKHQNELFENFHTFDNPSFQPLYLLDYNPPPLTQHIFYFPCLSILLPILFTLSVFLRACCLYLSSYFFIFFLLFLLFTLAFPLSHFCRSCTIYYTFFISSFIKHDHPVCKTNYPSYLDRSLSCSDLLFFQLLSIILNLVPSHGL